MRSTRFEFSYRQPLSKVYTTVLKGFTSTPNSPKHTSKNNQTFLLNRNFPIFLIWYLLKVLDVFSTFTWNDFSFKCCFCSSSFFFLLYVFNYWITKYRSFYYKSRVSLNTYIIWFHSIYNIFINVSSRVYKYNRGLQTAEVMKHSIWRRCTEY